MKRVINAGFADQAVVSLGSLLVLMCAAQGLSADGLGVFALAMSSVLFAQSLVRAFVGELLIVGRFGRSRDELIGAVSAASLAAFGAVALCLAVAVFFFDMREAFLGAACAMVGILLQDLLRYWFIASRSSSALLTADVIAVSMQCLGVLSASILSRSPFFVALAWGGGALVVACVSVVRLKLGLSFLRGISWFRLTWRDGLAYAAEATMGALVGYAVVLGLAAAHSASEVALFRVAMSVFGLTSLLISFARTTLVREAAFMSGGASIRRSFLMLMVVMTAAVAMVWGATLILPEDVGEAFFGPTWFAVVGIAAAAAVNRLGATWSVVPGIYLRSMGATWSVVRIRVIIGAVACGLGPVWAVIDGARGALLAEAVAYCLTFLALTVHLYKLRKL